MSLVSRAFLEHLRTSNTAGLDAVWSRSAAADRPALIAAVHDDDAAAEAHLFLRALVDRALPHVEQERLVRVGIDALSDLASRGSSDRVARLAQWARAGEVREALLVTAAQRGASASSELVEWLASAEDDALADALIPVFLAAVEARDGARLELLSALADRSNRLAPVKERAAALKAQARAEWGAFVAALGLDREPPFTLTCAFRASEPQVCLTINPVRLNWYALEWGPRRCDSTRRAVEGLPVDGTVSLLELPRHVDAAMRAAGLRGRRRLDARATPAVEARLKAWLGGATSAA
ncbi:MAG: hypothetical protein JNJ54_08670 [Myxococcaceae bacterium]|nr:hypothetical protein [Myxococcaceae bacterium]